MKSLIALLLLPSLCILDGILFSTLWSWFVVSAFKLPPISIAEAVGISAIAAFLRPRTSTASGNPLEAIGKALIRDFSVFFIGYIAHFFI